jgi:hypothetical protein
MYRARTYVIQFLPRSVLVFPYLALTESKKAPCQNSQGLRSDAIPGLGFRTRAPMAEHSACSSCSEGARNYDFNAKIMILLREETLYDDPFPPEKQRLSDS